MAMDTLGMTQRAAFGSGGNGTKDRHSAIQHQATASSRQTTKSTLEMATLWIGSELPPYVAACLASFARNGHPTKLYTYEELRNVPAAVRVEDASRIIDPAILARFTVLKKFSQFSNFFRYELLEKHDGICWIDADLCCLRPIEAEPYIFGFEDDKIINGAILALPSGSPILTSLRRMFLR